MRSWGGWRVWGLSQGCTRIEIWLASKMHSGTTRMPCSFSLIFPIVEVTQFTSLPAECTFSEAFSLTRMLSNALCVVVLLMEFFRWSPCASTRNRSPSLLVLGMRVGPVWLHRSWRLSGIGYWAAGVSNRSLLHFRFDSPYISASQNLIRTGCYANSLLWSCFDLSLNSGMPWLAKHIWTTSDVGPIRLQPASTCWQLTTAKSVTTTVFVRSIKCAVMSIPKSFTTKKAKVGRIHIQLDHMTTAWHSVTNLCIVYGV